MATNNLGNAVTVQQMFEEICTTRDKVIELEKEVLYLKRTAGGAGGGGHPRSLLTAKGGLLDQSTTLPEKLTRVSDFRDWSEDYREYVEQQDEHLVELLDYARDSPVRVTEQGATAQIQLQAKAIYRSLKRAMVLADARALVVTVADKNPSEAWRLLHAK